MSDIACWLPLLSRSIVVGLLGGASLGLTHRCSRRGLLIYPVYAAILTALAFVSARFESLPDLAHLSAVLSGVSVATAIAVLEVLYSGARQQASFAHRGGRLLAVAHRGGGCQTEFTTL